MKSSEFIAHPDTPGTLDVPLSLATQGFQPLHRARHSSLPCGMGQPLASPTSDIPHSSQLLRYMLNPSPIRPIARTLSNLQQSGSPVSPHFPAAIEIPTRTSSHGGTFGPWVAKDIAEDIRQLLELVDTSTLGANEPTASCDSVSLPPPDSPDSLIPFNDFHAPILASRVVIDLKKWDPTTVDLAALDSEAYQTETLSRNARDTLMEIYRGILGSENVHRNDAGQWVPADAPEVVKLQSALGGGNVTFALLCTAQESHIYYAQELDPQHASAPILPVHRLMGHAPSITLGALVVVDARRLVHANHAVQASTSAFARVNNVEPTLPSFGTSGEVIAQAIALKTANDSIVTRVHVSSLMDDQNAYVPIKAMLEANTDRDVDVTFLRDTGVRVVNSCTKTICELQALAVDINTLLDRLLLPDRDAALRAARKLLSEDHMRTLGRGLQFVDSDSTPTAKLSLTCATLYFKCLAGGIANRLWQEQDVWNALKTSAGLYLASHTGRRAAYHPSLGIAYIKVLDAMYEVEVSGGCISGLLVSPLNTHNEGFLKEYQLEARAGHRDAGHLIEVLKQRPYNAKSILNRTRQERAMMRARPFDYRSLNSMKVELQPLNFPEGDATTLVPSECLASLSAALCPAALYQMELTVLKTKLLEVMPSIPHGHQRIGRAAVESTVEAVWRKELPGEAAPSSLQKKVLESVGRRVGQQISEAIRPGRDRIVEGALTKFLEWLDQHPNVANSEVEPLRDSIYASAVTAYQTLITATDTECDAATRALATKSELPAATCAQELRTRQLAAAVAAEAKRASEAETRRLTAEASSRQVQSHAKSALRNLILERGTVESMTQASLRSKTSHSKAISEQVKAHAVAQTTQEAQTRKRENRREASSTATRARDKTSRAVSAASGSGSLAALLSNAPAVPTTALGSTSRASKTQTKKTASATTQ